MDLNVFEKRLRRLDRISDIARGSTSHGEDALFFTINGSIKYYDEYELDRLSKRSKMWRRLKKRIDNYPTIQRFCATARHDYPVLDGPVYLNGHYSNPYHDMGSFNYVLNNMCREQEHNHTPLEAHYDMIIEQLIFFVDSFDVLDYAICQNFLKQTNGLRFKR